MWNVFWGLKTHAMLDVWTIEHVLSGMSIGSFVCYYNKKAFRNVLPCTPQNIGLLKYIDIITVLFLAFLWEAIEHYLETGLAGQAVEAWFYGVEFYINRIILDPMAMLFGHLIAVKYTRLIIWSRIASALWLFVHIFIFEHSMYLHTFL